MMKEYIKTEEIIKQDIDGWTMAKDSAGNIWIGYEKDIDFFAIAKDTKENRKKFIDLWKVNSFSKEIKKLKQIKTTGSR